MSLPGSDLSDPCHQGVASLTLRDGGRAVVNAMSRDGPAERDGEVGVESGESRGYGARSSRSRSPADVAGAGPGCASPPVWAGLVG